MWFTLYKCIVGWLLPPGIFILFLFYAAWKIRKKETTYSHHLFYMMLAAALLLCALSNSVFVGFIARNLENYSPVQQHQFSSENVLIVLSGGITTDVPVSFSTKKATPSQYGLTRLCEALRLYHAISKNGHACTIIVTGGTYPGGRLKESDIYKEWLISAGIPEKDILCERESTTTFENAKYIQKILPRQEKRTLFLVTSAWHMKRSLQTFNAFGITTIPAPCDFTTPSSFTALSMVPNAETLSRSRSIMWEYIGTIYYSLKIHTMKTTKRTKHE